MKHYCVISHTHWDREWYMTQERFRLRLIDLMDHLLEILDRDPDYIFHMDAQTIVLEDYWEVKPEQKEKCCRYIAQGRFRVGPWYVQNDFNLTSGEATVRNLLLGMQMAESCGHCSQIGYAPDQFGIVGQLPQILRGFGLANCIFGRGYVECSLDDRGSLVTRVKPAEFTWKSPDGSEVLAVCLSFWYNNAQRFSENPDRAAKLVDCIGKSFEGVAGTPHLLLMNGVDHLEPQGNLLPILAGIQSRLPEGDVIEQTTMEAYLDCVRKENPTLPVHTGELKEGFNANLLKDTASSRIYLKIQNSDLQNLLSNRLEPLYTFLELSGIEKIYPAGQLDYLWKMLIRNHAHDSICGCSKDAVHAHMEDRFACIRESADMLLTRGLTQLAAHVHGDLQENDYQIVLFNALEQDRTEAVEVTVDVVSADGPTAHRITDPQGDEVPFEILSHEQLQKMVASPVNLPGMVPVDRYRVRLLAREVPAFGYVSYRVETQAEPAAFETGLRCSTQGDAWKLENPWLCLTVEKNGKVSLRNRETGDLYENLLALQDVADVGDSYMFWPAAGDQPVELSAAVPEISLEQGALMGTVVLRYRGELPACYDFEQGKRSGETVPFDMELRLSLGAEDRWITLRASQENRARDHRLRLLVRTGIQSSLSAATSVFDTVVRDKWSINPAICSETEHNSGAVTIGDDVRAVSVLNRGIYSYENLQSEQGTLAFTLVRSTGRINEGKPAAREDDSWEVPGNQCLRRLVCELAIYPQRAEEAQNRAVTAAKAFQNPMPARSEPVDQKKFLGGRAAVQDSTLAEFFYQPLPSENVRLPRTGRLLTLEGQNLHVTALRKAYDRSGYILRFYNNGTKASQASLHGPFPVCRTDLRERLREPVKAEAIPVRGKEIVTLFLENQK